MAHESLAVQNRDERGKGPARRMRSAGRIPAVLYGQGRVSTALSVDAGELDRLLRTSSAGMNTLIDLSGDVSGKTVLIRELQREPVRGGLVHADFYAIDVTEAIVVDVPLLVTGTAVGVGLGGVLEELIRDVQVSCLPDAIPDAVAVDVSALDIGDSIHVRELEMPEGATLVSDPSILAVSCMVSRKAVSEFDEEEGEAAEGEGEVSEGEGEGEGAPAEAEAD